MRPSLLTGSASLSSSLWAATEPSQHHQVFGLLYRGQRAEHRPGAGRRGGPLTDDQGKGGWREGQVSGLPAHREPRAGWPPSARFPHCSGFRGGCPSGTFSPHCECPAGLSCGPVSAPLGSIPICQERASCGQRDPSGCPPISPAQGLVGLFSCLTAGTGTEPHMRSDPDSVSWV